MLRPLALKFTMCASIFCATDLEGSKCFAEPAQGNGLGIYSGVNFCGKIFFLGLLSISTENVVASWSSYYAYRSCSLTSRESSDTHGSAVIVVGIVFFF